MEMDAWVQAQYRGTYCDKNGQLIPHKLNLDAFRESLKAQRPDEVREVTDAVKRLDREICSNICRDFPIDDQGRFQNLSVVLQKLKEMRPDLVDKRRRRAIVQRIAAENTATLGSARKSQLAAEQSTMDMRATNAPPRQQHQDEPRQSILPGDKQAPKSLFGFKAPSVFTFDSPVPSLPSFTFTAGVPSSTFPSTAERIEPPLFGQKSGQKTDQKVMRTDANSLAKKLERIHVEDSAPSSSGTSTTSDTSSDDESVGQPTPRISTPDFSLFSRLLIAKSAGAKGAGSTLSVRRNVEQAPLLSGDIVEQHAHDFIPQYGLLGSLADTDPAKPNAQMFLNTNVPISTFICGIQGSGKSHTTSCILENAVIPSPHLGRLESPVSTLVFSYGEWSSGGAGFNISEVTHLAQAKKEFRGHSVKSITVLTSPSNPAIKKLYQIYPNIRIIPFKLKAKTLDIGALRTLMAVDEKSTVPLYMAKVEAILRSIAATSKDGSLDYVKFKKLLQMENFNPEQTNMLDMRMNLLESFLDLTDQAPEPSFRPGEITIMDLSDAFISPNTACILFKLGMERFLQGPASGKLVVLDEAHKYMLKTPGSLILTNYLTKVIRLQRHLGARVVVSTQEPTVSTDLIALCSVTVIHRFTSPAWFNALRKHINAMEDDEKIMHDIENLETGEALVYAPSAVLGEMPDGTLVKATGRLLKLNIRDRITMDGGESIMAV